MAEIVQSSSRRLEILDVLLRYGWDYMRQLLTIGRADKPEVPPPDILRNILTDLGPVYVKLGQLLSTRPDLLPPEYIDALSTLQSNVPVVPPSEIAAFIHIQLPQPPEEIFSHQELAGRLGAAPLQSGGENRLVRF